MNISTDRLRRALQLYRPLWALVGCYLVIGLVLRIVLWWRFGRDAEVQALDLLSALAVGACNDTLVSIYVVLPLACYLWLAPARSMTNHRGRTVLLISALLAVSAALFLAAIEYFFFEEFNARFNLVAVDYLMYPTEVIGDIRSEYPVAQIAVGALGVSGAICWWLRHRLVVRDFEVPVTRLRRAIPVVSLCVIAAFASAWLEADRFVTSTPRFVRELAGNGVRGFVHALRTSEIDYHTFYVEHEQRTNVAALTHFFAREGRPLHGDGANGLRRHFAKNPAGLGKLNVVVIVEESLGAEFSKLFGGAQDLTPNLDALAQAGVRFERMYASGTRTVRGLEAIAASFPPIPSVSILRRPHNEHIATWGSVMQRAGYHTSFLYGGYGYFDNMNYFFGNNGFEVLDRTAITAVRFANMWGVSDEDLFARALAYYDERARSQQPFFSLIMTTSNHKPFTFRAGVPGVPANGGGRAAGVRYADFALGYFFNEARRHAWFERTLFVVVADHGARVYGKVDIPLRSYEIPLVLYAPKYLRPRLVTTLTTQIDIAPTVLGLLGFEYEAPFFGTDVLACVAEECLRNRLALFNHNYDVAAYRDGKLAILGLGKRVQVLAYDRAADRYSSAAADGELTDLTVAIYQTAYELFTQRRYH